MKRRSISQFMGQKSAGCHANPDAKRLYDDLLSNYNKLVRPVANVSDALSVKIKLKLSQLIDVVSFALGKRLIGRSGAETIAEPEEPDNDHECVGGAVLVRLQAAVEPNGLWECGHAARPFRQHLEAGHCPLQQVRGF